MTKVKDKKIPDAIVTSQAKSIKADILNTLPVSSDSDQLNELLQVGFPAKKKYAGLRSFSLLNM